MGVLDDIKKGAFGALGKPKMPTKPNPVEGGGGVKGGIQGNPWTSQMGIPVSPLMSNPFGGGGLAGALQGAFDDTTSEFNQAIGSSMSPNDPRFGQLGGFLQNLAINPQGFGGDVMNKIRTRLAEREAGTRENATRTVGDMGGRNFSSFGDVLANIKGASAQRLSEAELQAEIQDAMLRQTARGQGISGSVSLASLIAGLNSQAAQFAAGRQRPLIEGGQGQTGPGGQFDLLNENGEIMPFREDGTPLSAFEQERARQQRIAWMQQQGG